MKLHIPFVVALSLLSSSFAWADTTAATAAEKKEAVKAYVHKEVAEAKEHYKHHHHKKVVPMDCLCKCTPE